MFLLSCSSEEDSDINTTETDFKNISEEEKNFVEEFFFDFDEIEHYSIPMEDSELMDLFDKDSLTTLKKFKQDVLFEYGHSQLTFLDSLELIGFSKKSVDKSKLPAFHELFKSRYVDIYKGDACEAVFRDVFVFMQNSQVVGVAKICFSCNKQWITGSSVSSISFGQNGEIYDLADIINE